MSFDPEGDYRRQKANDLFLMGRAFVKSGDLAQARQLLKQAVENDPDHDQAWVWLSATTQDPAEQKQYLEWAVAANPGNALARRGLAVLTGRLNPKDIAPEGSSVAPPRPTQPETTVIGRTFTCPKCGGRMRFDPELVDLKCENCGFVEVVEEAPVKDGEQVLDFTLPTRRGHRWAEAERRMICQQCAAPTIFPQGQTSLQCPFCGSAAFVTAPEEAELLPPQGLIPMGIEDNEVRKSLKAWLGGGFFAPDDLMLLSHSSRPRPAYVPCWAFSATLTFHWRAMISEGYGKDQRWVWRTGEHTLFFTDQLQPGTRALPADLLQRVQPFDLSKLIEYKPEYLAGWPAATYDISLADASIQARGAMVADAHKQLLVKVAPGHALRDFEITGNDFTGQTYKLMLLPVWVGAYVYQGRTYRMLINGQTGKVAGDKPLDWVKMVLVAAAALILVALLAFLIVRFLR